MTISVSGPADRSVLVLGAAVSFAQSGLFVVIGVSALVCGADRLVDQGFAALAVTHPGAFRVLCAAFVAIAVLGLAITPAERALVEPVHGGLARFGAALAYVGHAGTIGFFSWWLASIGAAAGRADLDVVAPLAWGVMFELVFVGGWVWVLAGLLRARGASPGFVWLSVAKATSFWFAFLALLTGATTLIVLGLGAVCFGTGPIWHARLPGLLRRDAGGGGRVG